MLATPLAVHGMPFWKRRIASRRRGLNQFSRRILGVSFDPRFRNCNARVCPARGIARITTVPLLTSGKFMGRIDAYLIISRADLIRWSAPTTSAGELNVKRKPMRHVLRLELVGRTLNVFADHVRTKAVERRRVLHLTLRTDQ